MHLCFEIVLISMSYALYGVSYNTKKSTSSWLRYVRIFISLFHSTRSRDIKYLSLWFLGRISREVLFELNLMDEDEISDQWLWSVKQEKREMSQFAQKCHVVFNVRCKAEER